MGGWATGIMYGCELPKLPKGKRWNGESVKVRGEYVYKQGLLDIYVAKMMPEMEHNGGRALLGLWVSVGGSGVSGCPCLGAPAVQLAAITTARPYARAFERAVNAWGKFDAWCRSMGVDLPAPTLWITHTEVG